MPSNSKIFSKDLNTDSRQVVLSGSTVTGDLTIGNYIGAISQWKSMQEKYNCYYMVADLHGLTVKQDPKLFKEKILSFYAQYISLGLDPDKNTIFAQSDVPEHCELAWILNCVTPMGNLSRMTQFKEKSLKNTQNINAGLFTYPVLMASDILLYQPDLVPVGEDQKQHMELCRDLVNYFHNRYEETFKMPEAYIPKVGARIMSLQDPTKKMSKSDDNENSFVSIIDLPKKIQKKIKSAVTDSGTVVVFDEEKPGISNLITIYSAFSGKNISEIESDYQGKMYGHLKADLAELVCSSLKPVQEKYAELMDDKAELQNIMKNGAFKARERASKTLSLVQKNIGLK